MRAAFFVITSILILSIAFIGFAVFDKVSNTSKLETTETMMRLVCDDLVIVKAKTIYKPTESLQWLMYDGIPLQTNLIGNYVQKAGSLCFVQEVSK